MLSRVALRSLCQSAKKQTIRSVAAASAMTDSLPRPSNKSTALNSQSIPAMLLTGTMFSANETRCFSSAASAKVQLGDKVHVHLVGKLPDGEVFDPEDRENPTVFIVGARQMLPGIEKAVQNMSVGSKKSVKLSSGEGFGEYNNQLVVPIPAKEMNMSEEDRKNISVGAVLRVSSGEEAVVTKITDDEITIDLNHPFAGKELHFDIELAKHTIAAELPENERLVVPVEETKAGDGKNFPMLGDKLDMHYKGMLENGTVFDSSYNRGQPFSFTIGVGQVIKGWDEGVMQMSVGQKAKLYVPANKGYGANGAGDAIPPNSNLIFEVELLKINRHA